MNKYTDDVIAKMKAIGKFDFASAEKFGNENGLSARSVVAKVNALGLEYVKKTTNAKNPSSKPKARAKADIVASIEAGLGITLASLSKMTVADLEELDRVSSFG